MVKIYLNQKILAFCCHNFLILALNVGEQSSVVIKNTYLFLDFLDSIMTQVLQNYV